MNDYDDFDEYSSENSFRARSNTWPLNRPDLALPSSGANIDETLPEIELEDDDLFTTNENWSTGVVDHDIMSWDPILNAQNQQQQPQPQPQQQQQQKQQPQEATAQPSTVHHHHQQHPATHAQHQATTGQQHHLPPPSSSATTTQPQGHQRQPSVHLQLNHQQQPQALRHQHPHQQQPLLRHQDPQHLQQQPHHHSQQRPEHHHHHHHPQSHPQHNEFVDVSANQTVIVASQNAAQLHHQPAQLQHQQHQQTSPQPPAGQIIQQQQQHQTLNSSAHCLDGEDSNEYHLQQLHHLHLDNPALATVGDAQQDQFAPTLTSLCVHNTGANLNNDSYTNISPNQNHHHQHHPNHQHNHHHLQPLSSARYDLDPHVGLAGGEYDIKPTIDDTLHHQPGHHLHQHLDHQPHLHHEQQLVHHPHQQLHHHHHEQQPQHHPHPLSHQHHHQQHSHVSTSLDNPSSSSVMLSSSLGTSGIGLSGDLEDLDYKPSLDSAGLLHQNSHYDGEQQPRLTASEGKQQALSEPPGADGVATAGDTKQSDSTTTSSKIAKQNVPRRNAWGNMSYADLISQAINSTSDKRLTLSQIYDWMVQHVPYFKDKGDSNSSAGWKNSVRHNLSLHSRFKRLQNEGTGKSSWWTINPEANVGKCARRRAASMEASKYEKKRGRAKKKAEAIRQGLISYPSLTNSSLNGSTSTLEQARPSGSTSLSQFQTPLQQSDEQVEQETVEQNQSQQHLDQIIPLPTHRPQVQIQTLDQYGMDRPSQQQQQHLQQLQQSDARSCEDLHQQQLNGQQSDHGLFVEAGQQQQQHHHHLEQPRYEENNENSKLQQQQQQQQQSQYYYSFELSTAL